MKTTYTIADLIAMLEELPLHTEVLVQDTEAAYAGENCHCNLGWHFVGDRIELIPTDEVDIDDTSDDLTAEQEESDAAIALWEDAFDNGFDPYSGCYTFDC